MTYAGGNIHAGSRDLAHATAPRSFLRRASITSRCFMGTTLSWSSSAGSSNRQRRNRLPCFRGTERRYAFTNFSCMTSSTVTRGSSSADDGGITTSPFTDATPTIRALPGDEFINRRNKGGRKAECNNCNICNVHERTQELAVVRRSSAVAEAFRVGQPTYRTQSALRMGKTVGPARGRCPPASSPCRAAPHAGKAGLAGPSLLNLRGHCLPQSLFRQLQRRPAHVWLIHREEHVPLSGFQKLSTSDDRPVAKQHGYQLAHRFVSKPERTTSARPDVFQ